MGFLLDAQDEAVDMDPKSGGGCAFLYTHCAQQRTVEQPVCHC